MPICSALLKYGYSSFSLEILEYCDKNDLIEKEDYYFQLLKPEYNILSKAGSSLGHRHSDETRKKKCPILRMLVILNQGNKIQCLVNQNQDQKELGAPLRK